MLSVASIFIDSTYSIRSFLYIGWKKTADAVWSIDKDRCCTQHRASYVKKTSDVYCVSRESNLCWVRGTKTGWVCDVYGLPSPLGPRNPSAHHLRILCRGSGILALADGGTLVWPFVESSSGSKSTTMFSSPSKLVSSSFSSSLYSSIFWFTISNWTQCKCYLGEPRVPPAALPVSWYSVRSNCGSSVIGGGHVVARVGYTQWRDHACMCNIHSSTTWNIGCFFT